MPVTSQPRRRVLIVLQEMADGGTERVSLNLAAGLLPRGYDVELLAISRAPAGHVPPPGVRARVLDVPRDIGRLEWLVRALDALRKAFRDEADGTIVLTAMIRTNWLTALAAMLVRRRLCLVAVEHTLYGQLARHTDAMRRHLNLWLRRVLFRRFAAVVVPSQAGAAAAAQELRLDNKSSVVSLPNPVVMAPPCPRRPAGPVPVVLAVGRLHLQKDYPTLIDAFARVVEKRKAILRIVGDGPDRAQLEREIARRGLSPVVEFAGFVPDPAGEYAAAQVLVLASRWEILPTVVIEAMHHGCPVVATDCEYGPREILQDGRLGQLVPVGDAEALARGIEAALDAGEEADRAALQRRAADYGVEAAAAAYDALFRSLTGATPRGSAAELAPAG